MRPCSRLTFNPILRGVWRHNDERTQSTRTMAHYIGKSHERPKSLINFGVPLYIFYLICSGLTRMLTLTRKYLQMNVMPAASLAHNHVHIATNKNRVHTTAFKQPNKLNVFLFSTHRIEFSINDNVAVNTSPHVKWNCRTDAPKTPCDSIRFWYSSFDPYMALTIMSMSAISTSIPITTKATIVGIIVTNPYEGIGILIVLVIVDTSWNLCSAPRCICEWAKTWKRYSLLLLLHYFF